MGSQCSLTRLFRIVAVLCMGGISLETLAQDNLDFVSPPDNTRRPVDFDQAITVEWIVGDDPVRGPVSLSTSLGTVAVPSMITDDFGRATFLVRSDTAGTATLEASTVTDTITMQLRFEVPAPGSDLLELVPDEMPFGENSVLRTDENDREYWLAKNRIVFRPAPGIQAADLQAFIDDNGVIDRFSISPSLMVLVFDESQRAKPLRQLTRELEALTRPGDGFKPVRQAGLAAQLSHTEQAYMVPDEVIVRFVTPPTTLELDDFKDRFELADIRQITNNTLRYLAEIKIDQVRDPIQLATDMTADPLVANADPNLAPARSPRSSAAGEPGFHFQWYHRNDGSHATEDADVDTDLAWHFTEGAETTVVAIADTGFDVEHPDLVDNIDAATSLINVIDGDLANMLPDNHEFNAFGHGTNAAGVAGARGDNNKGYSGACPQCKLLLIRHWHDSTFAMNAQAVADAAANNASVLSLSWGFPDEPESEFWGTVQEAVDDGVTVVMAMTNWDVDNCANDNLDSSANPKVIAVSGVTDYDQRSPYFGEAKGHGTCMDVLAPTRGGEKAVHTTSVEMTDEGKLSTYWYNFSGTSAATPLVAGVIGLMKTLDPTLTPLEVQRILQDTADRVDPEHALYSVESGFSNPGGMPTHGYGRINAYEAVKLVATDEPADDDVPRGQNRKDLFLRDNPTDWGNTERASNTIFNAPRSRYVSFQSVDIKFGPSTALAPITTPEGFASFEGIAPQPGIPGLIYVRIRNRGPDAVEDVTLQLHAAIADEGFPLLPDEFWTNYPTVPAVDSAWRTIGTVNLPDPVEYSGSSIAGCPRQPNVSPCYPFGAASDDKAVIATLDLPAIDWDPGEGQRLVLLAVVHSDDDPVRGKIDNNPAFGNVEIAVAFDNNVTLWEPERPRGGSLGLGSLFVLFLLVCWKRQKRGIRHT